MDEYGRRGWRRKTRIAAGAEEFSARRSFKGGRGIEERDQQDLVLCRERPNQRRDQQFPHRRSGAVAQWHKSGRLPVSARCRAQSDDAMRARYEWGMASRAQRVAALQRIHGTAARRPRRQKPEQCFVSWTERRSLDGARRPDL